MFRYLLIKMDILRVENSKTHTSMHNSDFYKKLNNKLIYIIKDGFGRCDFYYNQIKDWFDDKCITQEQLFMNFSEGYFEMDSDALKKIASMFHTMMEIKNMPGINSLVQEILYWNEEEDNLLLESV